MKRDSFHMLGKSGFFSFLGLVLALAVVAMMSYFMIKTYFKEPSMTKETKNALAGQGIDTASYQGIIDSTRRTLETAGKQEEQYMNRMDNIR